MNAKAIIFDCDGTLVDSESVANEVLAEVMLQLGMHITPEEALRRFRGDKMADIVAALEHDLGRPLPEAFVPELRHEMHEQFKARLRPMDGAAALLSGLGRPCCVASNAPMEKLQVSLSVTGLAHYFEERIYSAYEVGSWKPDPGLFLHAATQMGVTPSDCLVVEDSLTGVTAGLAAGMQVVALDSTETSAPWPGDVRVIHSLLDLHACLD